ncbi:MAG: DMT family transporter [Gemmatimonadales bacterium]
MSRTPLSTALALVAFAANSLLCRLALSRGVVDPTGFSAIRLIAGATTLAVLVRVRREAPIPVAPSWTSAALLFLYALPFSFAYTSLSAGTGALLLFGAVQATMILAALRTSEHPRPAQWLGLISAFGGLIYLVLPGVTAPAPAGAGLMLLAGVAWGLYTLRGRGVGDPLGQTASNFARAVPMILIVSLFAHRSIHLQPRGLLLAVLSGALASGLGYVLWYQALAGLSKVSASIVQLAVPILAAAGGIVFLGERVSLRLLLASVLVLGGIGLGILAGTGARTSRPTDRG